MFVDASALVAILLNEQDAADLARRIESAEIRVTSPIAVFETVLALARTKQLSRVVASEKVQAALVAANIEVTPITEEIGRAALDAHERYGKGSGHPARLNMGDCFAYGAARTLALPLLFKGTDFTETDLGDRLRLIEK